MKKWLSIALLVVSILGADEPADIKAINITIGGLYIPQVRADTKRMAELTTPDFTGNLNLIPVRTVWCETTCEGFRVRSLKFDTADTAIVDGETTGTVVPMPRWLMILKKDSTGWRISAVRAFDSPPVGPAGRP